MANRIGMCGMNGLRATACFLLTIFIFWTPEAAYAKMVLPGDISPINLTVSILAGVFLAVLIYLFYFYVLKVSAFVRSVKQDKTSPKAAFTKHLGKQTKIIAGIVSLIIGSGSGYLIFSALN